MSKLDSLIKPSNPLCIEVVDNLIADYEEQIGMLKNLCCLKDAMIELVKKTSSEREAKYEQVIADLKSILAKKGVFFLDDSQKFEG